MNEKQAWTLDSRHNELKAKCREDIMNLVSDEYKEVAFYLLECLEHIYQTEGMIIAYNQADKLLHRKGARK